MQVSLRDFPEQEFGTLKGKVEKIARTSNAEGEYMIDISLTNSLMTTYNKEVTFKQEMQGNAQIITEDLRLLERFFYKFKTLLKK